MLTVPHHKTRKKPGKQKRASQQVNPKPFSDLLLMKKNKAVPGFIKRLSPFLISAILLPPFALYTFVAGVHLFSNMWLQLFVLTGIEVYLLFIDFALWNYFEGKKKLRIWIIEIALEAIVIKLLV